jgi:hypothetical protein
MKKLLVLVFVAVASLVPVPAVASPSFTNCWEAPSFNMYADIDEDVYLGDLIYASQLGTDFKVKRCRFNGIRIEVVDASSHIEYLLLRQEVRSSKGYRTPWLFCSTSYDKTRGYLVNWLWHTKEIKPFRGEERRYKQWALAWKKRHDCISNPL